MRPQHQPLGRLGRYTLVRPLGAGGMAELFLARAEGIEGFTKLCAVKRILPHKANNERFIRMFLNEARLVAALDHPNICHVHDIGREGGEYYFAMEYVHGEDLNRIVHVAPRRMIRLENALHIAIGLAAGLHHAHEARDDAGKLLGIVHRDVSPSNVLVSYQGAVKLVDFGVAKAATVVSETREGVVKGKYGYMSPEQCLGESVDRRSDIFSVGILLWELTVGRRLYKSSGELATLQRVVYVDAPRPSSFVAEYPPELERIVMRALARDVRSRYQSAQELQLDLEAFARDQRLSVSSVVMAAEMTQLFRHRVDAWHDAQEAGRSLADHLAELSADEPVASSNDDDLDDVIHALDVAAFSAPDQRTSTSAGGPAALAMRMTAPLAPPPPPPAIEVRKRSWAPILGALLLFTGGGAVALVAYGGLGAQRAAPQSAPTTLDTPEIVAMPQTSNVVAAAPVPVDIDASDPQDEQADAAVADVDAASATATPSPKVMAHKHPKRPTRVPMVALNKTTTVAAPDETEDVPPPSPPPPKVVQPASGSAAKPVGAAPGTVDPVQVRATVHAHIGVIAACVDRARMDDRDLSGKVVLRIDVDGSGKVTRATATSRSGGTPALETCIEKVVGSWTFPAPAGGVSAAFTYPFAF